MASLRTVFLCLALVFWLCTLSEAKEFVVGGKNKLWEVPCSVDEFNNWAQKTRFQIGDFLVFKYDSKTDSVLEVSEEDYKTCNKASPIKTHNDGETKIELNRSGLFFFISGVEEHCHKGQKLVVKVLSDKHGSGGHSSASAPAPAPSPHNHHHHHHHHHHQHHHAPAPAPKNGVNGLKAARFIGGAAVVGSLVGLALF